MAHTDVQTFAASALPEGPRLETGRLIVMCTPPFGARRRFVPALAWAESLLHSCSVL